MGFVSSDFSTFIIPALFSSLKALRKRGSFSLFSDLLLSASLCAKLLASLLRLAKRALSSVILPKTS